MAGRLLLIGCISLMLFAAHVQSLKCVVCGGLSELSMSDVMNGNIQLSCPDKLPDPTECKDALGQIADYKFCSKFVSKGNKPLVVRLCSQVENHECTDEGCAYSCNTDGCNGANILANKGNLLTMLMCVAFVVLVGLKRA